MDKIFIHPYKGGSRSAKALADSVGGKRILINGKSKYAHKSNNLVVNWGSSTKHVDNTPMLNEPSSVAVASNKLKFFQSLAHSTTRLVPFTTSMDDVKVWLQEGVTVCARTKLTGHSAQGLEIIDPKNKKELDIPSAMLYTKYVPKSREYRVHVFNGEVIRVQKKILRPEITEQLRDGTKDKNDIDWKIRNHDNGFIYITGGVDEECPEDVKEQALKAVAACSLDFGAVDVIWNDKKQRGFVLEINTSPGLEGETIDAYKNAILSYDASKKKTPNVFSDNPYIYALEKNIELAKRSVKSFNDKEDLEAAELAAQGKTHVDFCNWYNASLLTLRDPSVTPIKESEFSGACRNPKSYPNVVLFAKAIVELRAKGVL